MHGALTFTEHSILGCNMGSQLFGLIKQHSFPCLYKMILYIDQHHVHVCVLTFASKKYRHRSTILNCIIPYKALNHHSMFFLSHLLYETFYPDNLLWKYFTFDSPQQLLLHVYSFFIVKHILGTCNNSLPSM